MPRARSAPASGSAARSPRSTSTTGSPCCRGWESRSPCSRIPGFRSPARTSMSISSMRWERASPISSCARGKRRRAGRSTSTAREIAGTASWSPPGAGAPNGRIVARLARITMPGRGNARRGEARTRRKAATMAPRTRWPPIRGRRSISRRTHSFRRSAISAGSSSSRSPRTPTGRSTGCASRTTRGSSTRAAPGVSPGARSRRSSTSCSTPRMPVRSLRATAMPKG